jgi:acyl-CoA synthetase (NDP forming)
MEWRGKGMDAERRQRLERMFDPRSIAIFGAVHESYKFGHMVIQSLLKYGYHGKIYPICPGGGEVFGLKVYTSLDEARGPVDLARICVPAESVSEVMRDCIRYGVAGVEILSSGFAETGQPQGLKLQEEVVSLSQEGLPVLGPNCFGIHCPKGGLTLLPGFDFLRESGPVALISQSGGAAVDFSQEARMAGFAVSKVVSFGNGCDLDAVDLLDYLAGDHDTRYIGAYVEGVRDGRRFAQVLKEVTPRKPVLVWKGGLTPPGRKSALSHTGSLSGEAAVWRGLFAQTGALAVDGLEEMVDTMTALVHLTHSGRNVAIAGAGGAIGVFSGDLAHRWGLELPAFDTQTQRRLAKLFPEPGSNIGNPLDTGTPVVPVEAIIEMIEATLTYQGVDVLILVLLFHQLTVLIKTFAEMDGLQWQSLEAYLDTLLEAIASIRRRTGKNVVMVLVNRANLPSNAELEGMYRILRLRCYAKGVPFYPTVERGLRAIRNASRVRRP